MGQPGVGGLGSQTHKVNLKNKQGGITEDKLKVRCPLVATGCGRRCIMELWLIGMRLEGTETQQTHTSDGQYEGMDTLKHSQTQDRRTHTETQTALDTQEEHNMYVPVG